MKVITLNEIDMASTQQKFTGVIPQTHYIETNNIVVTGQIDNEGNELIVHVACNTGNVTVKIVKHDETTNHENVELYHNEVRNDASGYNAANEVNTPEFIIDNNGGINCINQPNAIWLADIVLKSTITGENDKTTAMEIFFAVVRLIKTQKLTTTTELMAALNECFVEVEYITDIVKLTPTKANWIKKAENDIDFIIESRHANYQKIIDEDIFRFNCDYFKNIYFMLIATHQYDPIDLIDMYDDIKMHQTDIEKQWSDTLKYMVEHNKYNVFKLNGQVITDANIQEIIKFESTLLKTVDGNILDILLANIDAQLEYNYIKLNAPITIATLDEQPKLFKYLINHNVDITTKLVF